MNRIAMICFAGILVGAVTPSSCVTAEEELARQASWDYPTASEIRAQLEAWLSNSSIDDDVRKRLDGLWVGADGQVGRLLLARVVETIALVDENAAQLVDACQQNRGTAHLPDCPLLHDEASAAVVRNNLRLFFGSWLADQRLYDEALAHLSPLTPTDVADPATLLFYQGAAYYRLRDKDNGLLALRKLLERVDTIPNRYATVAQLMEADLQPLKTDSLDEVARIMDSIHVRLGHGRAGKRVRDEEEDVVEKLDKMIEKLEEQRKKKQQQSQSGGNSIQSSQPMQDSMPAGGTGPGDVEPKKLGEEDDWGNLPPKERQEALQRLGQQFPSHYREVIEEYFRALARKDVESP